MSLPEGVFVGIEAEGRLRGVRTMFVEGPGVERFRLPESATVSFDHLYLGANNVPLSRSALEELAQDLADGQVAASLSITVEVPLEMASAVPREVYARCRVLLTAKVPDGVVIAPDVEMKLLGERKAAVFGPMHQVDLAYALDRGME